MRKLLSSRLALFLLGLLIILLAVLCYFWPATQPGIKVTVDPNVIADPNAVAVIGDYIITKQELEKRLMDELYPDSYDSYNEQDYITDAQAVLMKMVADKAMIIEARKLDHTNDEMIRKSVKQFREDWLVNLLFEKHLRGKLTVTDSQIQQRLKADPKLDRAGAEAMLKNTKANSLLDQYYSRIYEKFHVKKLSNNFPKAAKIHQRLLYQPKKPRKAAFIRTYQVKEELTSEEKDIVLVEYDYGKITLKDWFDTLCYFFSPPSRPRDLNTPKGVEQFLERVLRMPLFVSEAKLQGFDNDKTLLKKVRDYEDGRLLSNVQSGKYKEVKEPTKEQIIAYFNKNKKAFRTDRKLKIDLIWCQDLKTARKVKAELDGGKDFESVKQKYSLEKKIKPYDTYPGGEGLFWKDLWKADPNEITGPLKGFYRSGVKWRIVKILEKNPGELKDYSSNMEQRVKEEMLTEQRKNLLDEYGKELLKKYPYKVYAEKIKDIDPLDIP